MVVTQNGTVQDMSAAVVAFKVSRLVHDSTQTTAFINTTNITRSTTNIVWFLDATNIPPNGTYMAELWSYTGASTNYSRTLAQGRVTVINSLYDDEDATFPWPTRATNLSDYATIAYVNALPQVTNAQSYPTVTGDTASLTPALPTRRQSFNSRMS